MSEIQALLTRCRELGAEFIPQPDGKLKVRAPAPLPNSLREALKQNKAEVLALLTSSFAPSWPCPECHGSVRLESPDEHVPTKFWTCTKCPTWGVTRDGAPYPAVWINTQTVQ